MRSIVRTIFLWSNFKTGINSIDGKKEKSCLTGGVRIYLTGSCPSYLDPMSLRDRYYVLGAAQAFLLNDLSPGWQTVVLIEDEILSVLVAQIQ